MPVYRETVTTCPVDLPRRALAEMIRTVRILYRLSRSAPYRERILAEAPETARFNPGHDAVMMGYDFHLQGETPRLIEVNTNAGGGLLAFLSHHPSADMARERLPERLRREFLQSFADEMISFSGGTVTRPEHIAIIDEKPEEQFLYEEMRIFTDLFRESGISSVITDPEDLEAGGTGVLCRGRKIDLIYNRHTDFYLETQAMAGVRAAYLAGTVCLTPNPFVYALLADKRRLSLWSNPSFLALSGLETGEAELLQRVVPESHLLSELDRERIWGERKEWVFKPVSRFGSRGVLMGRKISRGRYHELPAGETLVQRLVPPSVSVPCGEGTEMKTDFRLYVYRSHVLGVAARLYQGQVTNLRTPGGGFAPVRVV